MIKLDLTADSRAAVVRRGLRVVDRLDVPPAASGPFRGASPNGRPDGVADSSAGLCETPLTLSGSRGVGTSAGDRALLRDQPWRPSWRRTNRPPAFARGDVIAAYVEAYIGAGTRIDECADGSLGQRRPTSECGVRSQEAADRRDGAVPLGCLGGDMLNRRRTTRTR